MSSGDPNPYAGTSMSAPPKPGRMQYMQSINYITESPKWLMNLLCLGLCMVIPVVGPLVMLGYQYEIIESLHVRPGSRYPDFDFNRFVDYLVRGLWPFLIGLIVGLIMFPIVLVIEVVTVGVIGAVGAAAGDDGAGIAAVIMFPLLFLSILGLSLLMQIIAMPLQLRAGLGQDFGAAFNASFVKQFIGNTWKEMILAGIFIFAVALVAEFVGLLMLCVGIVFTMAAVMLAQAHLQWQLYELHLARGGDVIPLKPPKPAL